MRYLASLVLFVSLLGSGIPMVCAADASTAVSEKKMAKPEHSKPHRVNRAHHRAAVSSKPKQK